MYNIGVHWGITAVLIVALFWLSQSKKLRSGARVMVTCALIAVTAGAMIYGIGSLTPRSNDYQLVETDQPNGQASPRHHPQLPAVDLR